MIFHAHGSFWDHYTSYMYINYLASVSKVLLPLLFADDSNVLLTGHNASELISSMNAELVKVVNWLHVNILSLNVLKTNSIMFRSPKNTIILY